MSPRKTANPVQNWFAEHLDFKTIVLLATLVGQTVFVYAKVVDRVNDLDTRVAKIEKDYVSSDTLTAKFAAISTAQAQQTQDIREVRQLLEVPVRQWFAFPRPSNTR